MGKLVIGKKYKQDPVENAVRALGVVQQHGKQKVVALTMLEAMYLTHFIGGLLRRGMIYEKKLRDELGGIGFENFAGLVDQEMFDEDGSMKWQLPGEDNE